MCHLPDRDDRQMSSRDAISHVSGAHTRKYACLGGAFVLVALAFVLPNAASANTVTACTALDICYCVNSDYRDAIDANVVRVRQLIADHKAEGKAIGYLSIP